MEPTVISSEHGFTLLEFLVALVILMVGMLGLLQTVNFAITQNTTGLLRHEALLVADEVMNREKSKPFTLISSSTAGKTSLLVEARQVNNVFKNYSVTKTIIDDGTTDILVKNIEIRVTWNHKKDHFTHSVATIVSK